MAANIAACPTAVTCKKNYPMSACTESSSTIKRDAKCCNHVAGVEGERVLELCSNGLFSIATQLKTSAQKMP